MQSRHFGGAVLALAILLAAVVPAQADARHVLAGDPHRLLRGDDAGLALQNNIAGFAAVCSESSCR